MYKKSDVVIIADWGNSVGRLYCVVGGGLEPRILGTRRIDGVKGLKNASGHFLAAANDWIKKYTIQKAYFCGAITSNIGWHMTGYAEVPASVDDVFFEKVMIQEGLEGHFLSGISTKNIPNALFNTARGEDILVYGLMALTGLKDGTICTPGTHTNWFQVKDNQIVDLLTGAAGESFDIFSRLSMLASGHENPSCETDEFLLGLDAMDMKPRPAMMHMLMSVRMLQLSGKLKAERSADYLSGLIVGEDCIAAMELFDTDGVKVITDSKFVNPYNIALNHFGQKTQIFDSADCAIAGVQALRTNLAN